MNARNEFEAAQQCPSPTNGRTVRLSLHGMHLALSELINVINVQRDNTILYREKDIKSSGIWGYVLAIDEAYKTQAQLNSSCSCEVIVDLSFGSDIAIPSSTPELDKLRHHVEQVNQAFCPKKYPNNPELSEHQQMHPQFRAGAQNACGAILRKIKEIEQAHYEPELLKADTTRCKPQSAPAHQCCTASHNQENPEGHEPAGQLPGCTYQCAQKP
ncbi:hypothetical protein [Photobacterium sp. TLY01]|uniref:hypothetical protein n=1 Tax=Photobacterium sp. TLY01 TaxID=2907534 RepID=UPI001F298DCE|nr:hypothetical protein [Photobacterium sp. TLY01]UIP28859.1 hypothetical protein LN341_05105 [Photobacterium sp. TLY01]